MSPQTLTRVQRSLAVGLAVSIAVVVGLGAGVSPVSAATTYSLSGHVYLGSTAVSAGLGEVAVQWTKSGTTHNAANVVTTDSAGNYSIPGLSGSYSIYFAYSGSGGFSSVFYPNTLPGESVTYVAVTTSDVAGIDGTLGAAADISGTVSLGSAGSTAPAGSVSVGIRLWTGASWGPWSRTSVDASGAYRFDDMLAGRYGLEYDYRGALGFQDTRIAFPFTAGTDAVVGTQVLPAGASIGGLVALEGWATPAGAGDVRISYQYWNLDGQLVPGEKTALTDADGRYEISGLQATNYVLTFSYIRSGAPQYLDRTTTQNTFQSQRTEANGVLTRAYVVSGHVDLGGAGEPAGVGDVAVILTPSSGPATTVYTDANGDFQYRSPALASYAVEFDYVGSGDYIDQSLPGTIGLDTTDLYALLEIGNSVSGVVRGIDSFPLSIVSVIATQYDPDSGEELDTFFTLTDETGSYSFSSLPAGWYSVAFAANGYGAQYWNSESIYLEPDYFYLDGGDVVSDIDAILKVSGGFSGTVTVPGMAASEYSSGAVTVEIMVYDPIEMAWVATGDIRQVDALGHYTITGLAPGNYRLRVQYLGILGHGLVTSPTMSVSSGLAHAYSPSVTPADPLAPGTLVKSSSSPAIYIVDTLSRLVPIATFATLTDGGHVTSFTTVPQSRIDAYEIASKPLGNLIQCGGPYNLTFATAGGLYSADHYMFIGWEKSYLSYEACQSFRVVDYPVLAIGAAYIGARGGQVYRVAEDGVAHPVIGRVNDGNYRGPYWNVITVNPSYPASLPQGPAILLPGIVVKTTASAAVYLTDGADHLVPVSRFTTLTDFGIPTGVTTVAPSVLANYTIQAPLLNAVACGVNFGFGSSGVRWYVAESAMSGLTVTRLSEDTCRLSMPMERPGTWPSIPSWRPPLISNALFLRPNNGAIVYYIDSSGFKQQIFTMATATALNGGTTPSVLPVDPAYLVGIPSGPGVVHPGQLIKSVTNPAVYLVDGSGGLIPIRSFESVSDLGLPTAYSVVPSSIIDSMVIQPVPLSNLVNCEGVLYLATGGRLAQIPGASTGSVSVSSLPQSLCAVIPKSGTLASPLFVKSPSSPGVFAFVNGIKFPVSMAQVVSLAGPNPIVFTTVNGTFLASIPDGPQIVMPGQLIKTASSAAIYMVNGAGGLIPIRSFESVSDMGLPTAYTTVSDATLTGLAIAAAPLSNLVTCGGGLYLAVNGRLALASSAIAGGLAATPLPAALCAVIPKGGMLTNPVFVKSPGSPAVFAFANGAKFSVSMAQVITLAGSNPIVFYTANAQFLASIPDGPQILAAGQLVKTAAAPAVFLADGAGGLIPISSFDSVAATGLGTGYSTVSQATIDALVIQSAPLGTLVGCEGRPWIAGQGKLWATTVTSTGGLPVQVLAPSLCAAMPKSASLLSTPAFVKSVSSPAVFALDGGMKRAVGSWTSLVAIAGGPVVFVATSPAFIASIPTGVPIP